VRKFFVWLFGIVVIGAVVLAATGYFAYRAARPALQSAREYVAGFGQQLDDLEKKVANQQPFAQPANHELTKDQVERFARVQNSVRAALGQRVGDIEAKYRHLKVNADGPNLPSVSDLLSGVSELSSVLVDARRAQVDALNQEKFSSGEYDWVRKEFYQAAGVNSVNRRLGDLQKLINSSSEGVVVTERSFVKAPAANRELVKPYQRYLDDWLPLLFFGL
jgi:hypothetical protein